MNKGLRASLANARTDCISLNETKMGLTSNEMTTGQMAKPVLARCEPNMRNTGINVLGGLQLVPHQYRYLAQIYRLLDYTRQIYAGYDKTY